MKRAMVVLVVLVLAACALDPYRCGGSQNCVRGGQQGMCLPGAGGSYCAFPDSMCSGGLRWDESAASAMAKMCVDGASVPRKWVREPTALGELYDIWGTGRTDLFAVGEGGAVHHSIDGGKTWQSKIVASGALFGIWGSGTNDIFVVGASGAIHHSIDGGASWTAQVSGSTETLFGVWGVAGYAFALGSNGTIVASTNGGQTWSPRTSGTNQPLRAASGSLVKIILVGGDGVEALLKGDSNGSNWRIDTTLSNEPLNGIASRVKGGMTEFHAVGRNGTIRRSTDGGSMWGPQGSSTANSLLDIWVEQGGTDGFIVGASGTILHSRDGGATWELESSGTAAALRAVWGSGRDVFVVGEGGTVLRYE